MAQWTPHQTTLLQRVQDMRPERTAPPPPPPAPQIAHDWQWMEQAGVYICRACAKKFIPGPEASAPPENEKCRPVESKLRKLIAASSQAGHTLHLARRTGTLRHTIVFCSTCGYYAEDKPRGLMGTCPGAPQQVPRWKRLMACRHPIEGAFSLEAFRRACAACCGGACPHTCGLPNDHAETIEAARPQAAEEATQTPLLENPDRARTA